MKHTLNLANLTDAQLHCMIFQLKKWSQVQDLIVKEVL